MGKILLNNAFELEYPDGFHVMDEEEKKQLSFAKEAEGECLKDDEHHVMISIAWQKLGGFTDLMLNSRDFAKNVYERALALDCEVYHFHDPELLPYGAKLKQLGKKVIFDSHEDVPGQILDKEWLPFPVRKLVSVVYKLYETNCVKQFDAVVTATPHIAEKFNRRCRKVIVINNYPKLDDIEFHDTPFDQREPIVCYAGGISEIRGEKIMVEAMENVAGTLILAGPHDALATGGDKTDR